MLAHLRPGSGLTSSAFVSPPGEAVRSRAWWASVVLTGPLPPYPASEPPRFSLVVGVWGEGWIGRADDKASSTLDVVLREDLLVTSYNREVRK
eukprot:4369874-Amphidinium_carterae.1